ncbi:unnamed protein product, partial [marine sediment metagenome]
KGAERCYRKNNASAPKLFIQFLTRLITTDIFMRLDPFPLDPEQH